MSDPKRFEKPKRPEKVFTSQTYEIDPSWSYSDDHWAQIAKALGHADAETAKLRARITDAACIYQGRAKREQVRPRPGGARRELQSLDASIIRLKDCAARLSDQARDALNDFGMSIDGKPVTQALTEAIRVLNRVHSTIGAASDAPAAKGRLETSARRQFISELAHVWKECHGKRPGRSQSYKGRAGRFQRFVEACLTPLDNERSGLDDDIRAVVAMGKSHRASE